MTQCNDNVVTDLAERLFEAERLRRPIEALTKSFPDLSVEDAYHVQRLNIDRRVASGECIVGHKVGLTARSMQEKFCVDEPDYGHLLDTMVRDERSPFNLGELIDPQIEVEPAFFLGKALRGPNVTLDEVLSATDYISVCFEIIDSRIIDWDITLQDTVADNGSSSRVIFGAERVRPDALDIGKLETRLELDGRTIEIGSTSEILGHPANGIAWLANALSRFDITLEAGEVILPGTSTPCHRMEGAQTALGWIAGMGEVVINLTGQSYASRNRT